MRRTAPVFLCSFLVILAALPAGAADPSSVDQISASAGPSTVTVTGTATFRDVPVETGTDGSGDATMPGTDLTRATISAPTATRLKFRLDHAGAIPELSSSPAAVFLWPITVDENNTGLHLHASRARAGAPPNTPHLRVVTIAGGSITTVATVNGTMAGGVVEWEVPLGNIGAEAGSVITSDTAIVVIPGISGVGTLNGNNYDDMSTDVAYTVPSREVLLGVAALGDPISPIFPATVLPNNTFSAEVPKPGSPGSYEVGARACYGPQSCGTGGTSFTV